MIFWVNLCFKDYFKKRKYLTNAVQPAVLVIRLTDGRGGTDVDGVLLALTCRLLLEPASSGGTPAVEES